ITLDFYASTAADFGADQIAEGRRYLGSGSVITNASGAGAFDSATFLVPLGPTNPGEWITATATDRAGNTSEFSAALALPLPSPGGPHTSYEGDTVILDASATLNPAGATLTYSWDVNGDGIYGDAPSGADPHSPLLPWTWAQLNALNPPINDGPSTFNVSVRV